MALAPPSVWTMVVPDRLDIALLVVSGLTVAIGWWYLHRARELRSKGRPWPRQRSACFLAGLVIIAFAAEGGLARYDDVLFSVHTVQHVLLGMLAPVLLALGAPITLALQTGDPVGRWRLRRALDRARLLTHPLLAWVVFDLTLFALYFTPLYELSLRNDFVHIAVHVHFVVAGTLFAMAVVGLDPQPVRLPHPARLLLVALTVPVHAFLGVALLSMNTVIAGGYYASGARPAWAASPLSDQRTGAGILWGVGELFGVAVAAVVMAQWMRHSEREAHRLDRALDAAAARSGARS